MAPPPTRRRRRLRVFVVLCAAQSCLLTLLLWLYCPVVTSADSLVDSLSALLTRPSMTPHEHAALQAEENHKAWAVQHERFVTFRSVADWLDIQPQSHVSVAIPLHAVFVGFATGGNRNVSLTAEEMHTWFHELDHVVPFHVVRRSANVGPHAARRAPKRAARHVVRATHAQPPLHFNYTAHVVSVGPKAAEVIARAVQALARPENPLEPVSTPDNPAQLMAVDADAMERILANLLAHLRLENAYTLVVLNPKMLANANAYGYRHGLGLEEVRALRMHGTSELFSHEHGAAPVAPRPPVALTRSRVPSGRFRGTYSDHAKMSEEYVDDSRLKGWLSETNAALDAHEDALRRLANVADVPRNLVPALHYARTKLMEGDVVESAHIRAVMRGDGHGGAAEGMAVGCLTDAWVGQGRMLWLDISAGPFEYGHRDGGAGSRHNASVPRVANHDSLFDSADLPHAAALSAAAVDDNMIITDADTNDPALLKSKVILWRQVLLRHCSRRLRSPPECAQAEKELEKAESKMRSLPASKLAVASQSTNVLNHNWTSLFGQEHEHAPEVAMASRDKFLAHLGAATSAALRHVITPGVAMLAEGTAASGTDRSPAFISPHPGTAAFRDRVHFHVYVVTDDAAGIAVASEPHFDLEALRRELLSLALPSQTFSFTSRSFASRSDGSVAVALALATRWTKVRGMPRSYYDSTTLYHHLQSLAHTEDSDQPAGSSPRAAAGGDFAARLAAARSAPLEVPIFVILPPAMDDSPTHIDVGELSANCAEMVATVHNPAGLLGTADATRGAWEGAHDDSMVCGACGAKSSLRIDASATTASTLRRVVERLSGLLPYAYGPPRGAPAAPHAHADGASADVDSATPWDDDPESFDAFFPSVPSATNALDAHFDVDYLWSTGHHPLSYTSAGGVRFSQLTRDAVARQYALVALHDAILATNRAIWALATESPQSVAPLTPDGRHDAFIRLKHVVQSVELEEKHSETVKAQNVILAHLFHLDYAAAASAILPLEERTLKFLSAVDELHASLHASACAHSRSADAKSRGRGWTTMHYVWLGSVAVAAALTARMASNAGRPGQHAQTV